MCGIAGFIIQTGIKEPSFILQRMTDSIVHRGPDDSGFYETSTRNGIYLVGMGHRRLSIIDLENGHQPMGNEDGSIQIVFNGEIYNFQELRNDLIDSGHHFITNSDTETIVHAYEKYGEACVEHLHGMFAFALWDAKKEELLLARDRFGKKPLFLYEHGKLLLFASEIKALLTFPGIAIEADMQSIWEYLAYRYVPGPATLFSGILKLLPATVATWKNGNLKKRCYYTPPDQHPREENSLDNNPVKSFLKQLDNAVKIRMISDVPFGAFLSGGIDSSALIALMVRHSSLPINTFSVGFAESKYSELSHAKVIAEQFGTDHHELIVSQDHIIDELPDLIRFRDAPVSEPSDIPIYLLSREAGRSVKMVLTGEGSDEFLGGYPKHVFEPYVHIYQRLPYMMRHGILEPLINALPYRFHRIKTCILNLGLEEIKDRLPRWFGALSNAERSALVKFRPTGLAASNGIQFDTDMRNSALRCILYFDQTSWLPDNLLERGDRMTMAASLEARMPFIDYKLAAFVSSLPDHFRVHEKQTKWILRQAMKHLLPHTILNRPKVGFRVPVNEWFHGAMRDYIYDHLTGSGSMTRDYYHPKILAKALDEHVKRRRNNEKLLWSLLNLEIWHQQYMKTGA